MIRYLGALALVAFSALGLSSAPAQAAEFKPTRIDGSPLWPVHYYAPPEGKKTDGLVIMISDNQGWDAAAAALARHLADGGQVVAGLELPVYRAALQKEDNDCVLVTRDLEVLARDIEQTLPFSEYRPPVILGLGAGSGIAYAAAGQELPNTFAGGIGLRFDPVIDVGHKLCLPLALTTADAPLRYAPVADHETPWLFTPAAGFTNAQTFVAAMPQAHLLQGKSDAAAVDEAMRALPSVGEVEASVDGLPIVELPPPASAVGDHPLVIFYSGDGGWRDIDKKIGGYLSEQGYYVVGIDSLRYFWRKKDPAQMASDLDRLVRHYHAQAKGKGIILVGYSFGADVLPFMANRMAPDTKAQVKLISLMGIAQHASFEIRLQGILGASNNDGPPTLPELSRLKGIPIQCVFGEIEKDSVCAQKELDDVVTRIELNGGHHFDGDYKHTADLIISADKTRVSNLK